jgi:hypothetical protein
MDTPGLTPTELAYFAGYLEGEGCFTVNSRSPRVCVGTTYPGAILRLHEAFGGGTSDRPRNEPRCRPQFEWYIYGQKAIDVCKQLMPYLDEKRPQAEAMIAWYAAPCGSVTRRIMEDRLNALKRIHHV